MFTSILAIVTAMVGVAVIIAGVWGGVVLAVNRAETPIPLRYYAIVIGTIGTGVGLLGIAQGLRILLLILDKVAIVPPRGSVRPARGSRDLVLMLVVPSERQGQARNRDLDKGIRNIASGVNVMLLIAQIALGVIIGGLTIALLVTGLFVWNSRQKTERLAVGLFLAGALIVVVLVAVAASY
jgi:hypothetical protein